MIHRPPTGDFSAFVHVEDPPARGKWVLYFLAFFALGAALSGIVSAFRGWSTHSHTD